MLCNITRVKGVNTTYEAHGGLYVSYVIGDSLPEIKNLIKQRNLNERIVGKLKIVDVLSNYKCISDYEFLLKLPEIFHTACFIAMVASKAGTIRAEELIYDEGLLHELSHLMTNSTIPSEDYVEKLREKFYDLQTKAPGLYVNE